MCRAHNADNNKRQNESQACSQFVSGLFFLPYQSRLLAHHTTCINICIQTSFIMDVTSEDSTLPHLVPFGRLPCCAGGQHRAHDVLLLSCWSSCSFNLPALSQFTVQTNSIFSTHGKVTKNELWSPCSGWCKDRLCPADFWLPPPGAFLDIFRSILSMGYGSCATPSVDLAVCMNAGWETSLNQLF